MKAVMGLKKLNKQDVKFTVTYEPEGGAPENHFHDDEAVKWVKNPLQKGNMYAWCQVCVKAEWNTFRGVDYLGACSYENQKAFEDDSYLSDMKERALEDLNDSIASIVKRLSELFIVEDD